MFLISRLQEDDNVDSLDLKLDKYESADKILYSKKKSYKVIVSTNRTRYSVTLKGTVHLFG